MLVMRAFFRICVNENPPGLQQVEKLAMPLKVNLTTGVRLGLITEHSIDYGGHKSSVKWCLSFPKDPTLKCKSKSVQCFEPKLCSKCQQILCHSRIFSCG